jgi:hypothetical protein
VNIHDLHCVVASATQAVTKAEPRRIEQDAVSGQQGDDVSSHPLSEGDTAGEPDSALEDSSSPYLPIEGDTRRRDR